MRRWVCVLGRSRRTGRRLRHRLDVLIAALWKDWPTWGPSRQRARRTRVHSTAHSLAETEGPRPAPITLTNQHSATLLQGTVHLLKQSSKRTSDFVWLLKTPVRGWNRPSAPAITKLHWNSHRKELRTLSDSWELRLKTELGPPCPPWPSFFWISHQRERQTLQQS